MTRSQSRRNTDNGANLLELPRRDFLAALATTITVVGIPSCVAARPKRDMYGEIGKIIAVSGKRDEVIENILNDIGNMPGCLSYIVAKDVSNGDAIWISEVWDSRASHDASLALPSVKDAIAKNLPLIAGMGDSTSTIPVGGHGLSSSKYR